jgi:DNA-directed RNA polymerase specialized sigma24 family protein
VIALRFMQDFSEAEIARTLRVSVGTVKKTTHRAITALRAHLGRDWENDFDAHPEGAFGATL